MKSLKNLETVESSDRIKHYLKTFYESNYWLVVIAAMVSVFIYKNSTPSSKILRASISGAETAIELNEFPITKPTIKYGFAVDTFQQFKSETIQNGEYLADILIRSNLNYNQIDQLVQNTKDVFNVNRLVAGKPYSILSKDTTQAADYFIYEPNVYEFVLFDLKTLNASVQKREVKTTMRQAGGKIETSLWDAMVNNGLSFDLAALMEDALQWSIDFNYLQPGDEFKLIYEENSIDGKPVGANKVYAAYYKNFDNEYYSIFYDNEKNQGYYDLEGRPMKSFFLKAPVKYSRISSRFNPRRYHPVLKRVRPHYGTDYAAPYGTPIYSVGNGVVEIASYTRGNGNYVKIKHDDTYKTQYLHMQKFAKGIRSGVHVKQGQVIGYVGSTGLATGPHVCFRFWKNGKQINHLSLSFPPPNPLPKEDLPGFETLKKEYLELLNSVDTSISPSENESNT